MNMIDRVFGNLDKWRHFPGYQLERRADIYFSLYLLEVMEKYFGEPMLPVVVPEFPAYKPLLIGRMDERQRKLVLGQKSDDPTAEAYHRSYRIDYLVLSRDMSKGYLVEIKTDQNSWGQAQRACLDAAAHIDLRSLLEALRLIVPAAGKKDGRPKYRHLLLEFRALGLVNFRDSLSSALEASDRKSVRAEFQHFSVSTSDPEMTVVYIAPQPTNAQRKEGPCIDFELALH